MLMISRVRDYNEATISCSSLIAQDNPLLLNGLLPPYCGLELLAQASGLLLGLNEAVAANRPGAIVQVKSFETANVQIPAGASLDIRATYRGGSPQAALFNGQVFLDSRQFFTATLMIALLPEAKEDR